MKFWSNLYIHWFQVGIYWINYAPLVSEVVYRYFEVVYRQLEVVVGALKKAYIYFKHFKKPYKTTEISCLIWRQLVIYQCVRTGVTDLLGGSSGDWLKSG